MNWNTENQLQNLPRHFALHRTAHSPTMTIYITITTPCVISHSTFRNDNNLRLHRAAREMYCVYAFRWRTVTESAAISHTALDKLADCANSAFTWRLRTIDVFLLRNSARAIYSSTELKLLNAAVQVNT